MMPPSRTDPTCFGFAGSDTSNCFISPVPQHETYKYRSSTDRSMSVMSGGTAANGLRAGGRRFGSAGSAGMVMTFSAFHSCSSRNQRQTEPDRSSVEITTPTKPQVDPLHVLTLGKIPEVDGVAVLLAQQQFRHDAVLDHRWAAPLARDQHVL